MGTTYFERRTSSARGSDSIAADIMRHLHSRQHLGTTVIVCEQPMVMLSAARKQWLKLSRNVQKQRASTLNADKILKYTHAITRMQHMRFTMKSPLERPESDIFFLRPDQLEHLPSTCMNVYVMPKIDTTIAHSLTKQMALEGLIVDYDHTLNWEELGLKPKQVVEHQVMVEWDKVVAFLEQHEIDPKQLNKTKSTPKHVDVMDDALDELLSIGRRFLQVADSFQHILEIARPLRVNKEIRDQFDVVILLAHRVQALSPGTFTQRFLETYNEDDTFYLYERVREYIYGSGESLLDAIIRHQQAGRPHLAEGILNAAFLRGSQPRQMGRSLRCSKYPI